MVKRILRSLPWPIEQKCDLLLINFLRNCTGLIYLCSTTFSNRRASFSLFGDLRFERTSVSKDHFSIVRHVNHDETEKEFIIRSEVDHKRKVSALPSERVEFGGIESRRMSKHSACHRPSDRSIDRSATIFLPIN